MHLNSTRCSGRDLVFMAHEILAELLAVVWCFSMSSDKSQKAQPQLLVLASVRTNVLLPKMADVTKSRSKGHGQAL